MPDTNPQATLPEGFQIIPTGDAVPAISYRTTGMQGIIIFLIFWLSIWTIGCLFLLKQTINGEYPGTEIWFPAVFWGAELLVLGFLLWMLFLRTTFFFREDRLVIEKQCLIYRKTKEILKPDIRKIVQVKDGGEGDDSFPSWGLKLEGTKKISLLFRQPIEKAPGLAPSSPPGPQSPISPPKSRSNRINPRLRINAH